MALRLHVPLIYIQIIVEIKLFIFKIEHSKFVKGYEVDLFPDNYLIIVISSVKVQFLKSIFGFKLTMNDKQCIIIIQQRCN